MNRARVILKPLLAITFHLSVILEKKLPRIFMAPSPHKSVMGRESEQPILLAFRKWKDKFLDETFVQLFPKDGINWIFFENRSVVFIYIIDCLF